MAVVVVARAFLLSIANPLVSKWAQTDGAYAFNPASIFALAELLKYGVCVIKAARAEAAKGLDGRPASSLAATGAILRRHVRAPQTGDAVPALLYGIQNNLTLAALRFVTVTEFQVVSSTRAVLVTLLTHLLLKRVSVGKWFSVAFTVLFSAQFYWTPGALGADWTGVGLMLVVVACAAAANLYNQKAYDSAPGESFWSKSAPLYLWGVVFNTANWAFSVLYRRQAALGRWGAKPAVLVLFNCAFGLSIGAVFRDLGAIARSVISGAVIAASATIDVAAYGRRLTTAEGFAVAGLCLAVAQYTSL